MPIPEGPIAVQPRSKHQDNPHVRVYKHISGYPRTTHRRLSRVSELRDNIISDVDGDGRVEIECQRTDEREAGQLVLHYPGRMHPTYESRYREREPDWPHPQIAEHVRPKGLVDSSRGRKVDDEVFDRDADRLPEEERHGRTEPFGCDHVVCSSVGEARGGKSNEELYTRG